MNLKKGVKGFLGRSGSRFQASWRSCCHRKQVEKIMNRIHRDSQIWKNMEKHHHSVPVKMAQNMAARSVLVFSFSRCAASVRLWALLVFLFSPLKALREIVSLNGELRGRRPSLTTGKTRDTHAHTKKRRCLHPPACRTLCSSSWDKRVVRCHDFVILRDLLPLGCRYELPQTNNVCD